MLLLLLQIKLCSYIQRISIPSGDHFVCHPRTMYVHSPYIWCIHEIETRFFFSSRCCICSRYPLYPNQSPATIPLSPPVFVCIKRALNNKLSNEQDAASFFIIFFSLHRSAVIRCYDAKGNHRQPNNISILVFNSQKIWYIWFSPLPWLWIVWEFFLFFSLFPFSAFINYSFIIHWPANG